MSKKGPACNTLNILSDTNSIILNFSSKYTKTMLIFKNQAMNLHLLSEIVENLLLGQNLLNIVTPNL